MKKIFLYLIFSFIFVLASPLSVYAIWVDADRSGQENINIYNYSTDISTIDMELDPNGRPHIVWGDSSDLYYLYFDGSAWVDADGSGQESMVVYSGNIVRGELEIDSVGRPHVVFWIPSGLGYLYWNGSAWVDADGTGQESVIFATIVGLFSFDLNSADQPGVVWLASLMGLCYLYWNGSAWVDADGTGQESKVFAFLTACPSMSLKFNENSRPAVLWNNFIEGPPLFNYIYYLYFDGSAWVDADGTDQGEKNIYPATDNVNYLSLAINSLNQPAAAWDDATNDPKEIFYLYFDGSAWVDADGTGQGGIVVTTVSGTAIRPSLALDGSNNPNIAFIDNPEGNYDIYLLKWNGSSWVDVDGTGQDGVSIYPDSGASLDPILKLGSDPHIAWRDNTDGNYNPYYLEWWEEDDNGDNGDNGLPQTGGSKLIFLINRLFEL